MEFVELSSTGNWLKGNDLVDHWVLFHTKAIEKRNGQYGEQDVAIVDFANLSNGDSKMIFNAAISGRAIVATLQNAINGYVVGLIQKEVNKKGQPVITIRQPAGLQYENAKKKASEIVEGKSSVNETSDDLEDLLG